MEATWHKLSFFYRTPQARFAESEDLVSAWSVGSWLLTHPLPSAESWTLLLRLWSGIPGLAETPRLLAGASHRGVRVGLLSPQHPPEALQALWGHGEELSPVGSMSQGTLCLYRGSVEHELASALTQQVIRRGKLREGKRNFNNIRKTCLGLKWVISQCRVNDFYHLGLFWVGFWAEQANDDSGSLWFCMACLLLDINRRW